MTQRKEDTTGAIDESLDLGLSGKVSFSLDAMKDFIRSEQSFWSSILADSTFQTGSQTGNHPADGAPKGRYEMTWDQCNALLKSNDLEGASRLLTETFNPKASSNKPEPLVSSKHPIAKEVVQLFNAGDKRIAGYLLACAVGSRPKLNMHQRNHDLYEQTVAVAKHESISQSPEIEYSRIRRNFEHLTNKFDDQYGRNQETIENYWSSVAETDQAHKDLIQSLADRGDSLLEGLKSQSLSWKKRCEEDKSKIESLYHKHMQLEAAVTYWDKMAIDCAKKARNYENLLFLVIIGGCLIGFAFILLVIGMGYDKITSTEEVLKTLLVRLAAIGIVTAFFIFGIRALTRLAFSFRHLAADASERSTLIKTFMAMLKDNTVNEDDRSVVLASIFRASPSGFIKEDNVSSASHDYLLKLMSQNRT